MQTTSRGGFGAAALGLGVLLARLPRPWPRFPVLGAVGAFWIVLGLAVWLPAAARFGKAMGGQDLSILSRLGLWRAAPRMIADAPGGWGLGHSADVFHQWYQPVDQSQLFTSLINSHLTWLVEIGWTQRFLYVFGWLAVPTLCWLKRVHVQKYPSLAVPLGLWIAFGVTAWFNSVAESPWLWLVPAAGLGGVLWWRWHAWEWPGVYQWVALAGASGVLLGLLLLSGGGSDKPPHLRLHGARVVLGQAPEPAVWLLVDRQTLGSSYGQTLRRYLQKDAGQANGRAASIGLVNSLEDLPLEAARAKVLAVCAAPDDRQLGRLKTLLPVCSKLVLLNPAFFPQALGVNPSSSAAVEVVAGEFSQAPISAWTEVVKSPPIMVPGAGDYLARWPELLLAPHSPTIP